MLLSFPKFIKTLSEKDGKCVLGKMAENRFSYVRVHSLIAYIVTESLVLTG